MRVLVTGANGYLASGVCKNLLDKGYEVVAACHRETNLIDNRATVKVGDIFMVEHPYEFYEKPDVLLHMAWRDGFVHYSNSHIQDLPKHVSFIEKMAKSDIGTIAVMGSMHEIGFYEGSVDENTPCHPQSFYGIAKNALRDATQLICSQNKKNFLWLRGYYIVGNALNGSSVFSKIVQATIEGKKHFPFTQGLNQFDFIDYDIFCEQVSRVVIQEKVRGIINICSGRPEKLADRVERFINENGYDIQLDYGAFPDRPYDSKAIWGNNKKIMSIIGE